MELHWAVAPEKNSKQPDTTKCPACHCVGINNRNKLLCKARIRCFGDLQETSNTHENTSLKWKGHFFWAFFSLLIFWNLKFIYFHKKCSNAFIQSLYRNGNLITGSEHANKVMVLTKHLSTRTSGQQSFCSDKKIVRTLKPAFLQNNIDLQKKWNALMHCTWFI